MKLRFVIYLFLIVIIPSSFFYYRNLIWPPESCTDVIEFSIGEFDDRFGLTRSQFVKYIEQATKPWEKAAGKDLFKYSAIGDLKINLIYDNRQQFTEGLNVQSELIDKDLEIFTKLKTEYDSLISRYDLIKADYESQLSTLSIRQADYNNRVNYLNERGGATSKEYADLNKEKEVLNRDIASLNKSKEDLNTTVSQINAIQPTLANMADKYNVKIRDYNLVVSLNDDEFTEGEHVYDIRGNNINIYQFANPDKLVILLAHELGHTLGLGHVEDENALMHYLNNNKNPELNESDLAELKRVCPAI